MDGTISIEGTPTKTYKWTLADSPAVIPTAVCQWGGQIAVAALITCETNNARFTLGDGATCDVDTGHQLAAGQSLRLGGWPSISTFQACNETAGNNAVLHITCFFAG